jgi:hypothetical protein
MTPKIVAWTGALLLAGCASTPGVMPLGGDTYTVAHEAGTGLSGTTNLKAAALREADAFCKGQGKALQVTDVSESKPPYLFGNYPRAEVKFRCAAA